MGIIGELDETDERAPANLKAGLAALGDKPLGGRKIDIE
jgi:hypothetical protein